MIKLIKKIVLLLIILFVLDRVSSTILEKIFYKQTHGDDYVSIQLFDSTKASIIILGSSRASHHYVSDSIEKFSNLTVYNGGRDNMGIQYFYAALKIILSRYKPSKIIIDLIPTAFLKGNQDQPKFLDVQTSVLLPFANKHRSIYDDVSQISLAEKWKALIIKTYSYNSLVGTIFQNAFTNMGHKQIKGYEPLIGKIDETHYKKPLFPFPNQNTEIDTNAVSILQKCISICNQHQIQTTIIFSPFYFEQPNYTTLNNEFNKLKQDYDCTILDFSRDSLFVKNASLFYDELHLNDSGAVIFSKKVIDTLK